MLTPRLRNDIVEKIFNEITEEDYFLGFKYNGMKQTGSCNCSNSGFLRIPKFTVVHKKLSTVLTFKTHHGDTKVIKIDLIKDAYDFEVSLKNKITSQLEQYSKDWD